MRIQAELEMGYDSEKRSVLESENAVKGPFLENKKAG
jgi:hypothetical protein